MRLFTALWLPAEAVTALLAARGLEPAGWRFAAPETWHVTLAFHGEADPGPLARRLDAAAHGLAVPRLRVAGSGSFERARWAGIEPVDALLPLVAAAGGDVAAFVPHVTLLRRRARPGPDAVADPPAPPAPPGPWWTAQEVLLAASEPARGGVRYRTVHRVPLAGR
jgi:RNA 2',3'-cyclic 3'-phosphodiesterase